MMVGIESIFLIYSIIALVLLSIGVVIIVIGYSKGEKALKLGGMVATAIFLKIFVICMLLYFFYSYML